MKLTLQNKLIENRIYYIRKWWVVLNKELKRNNVKK